MLYEIKNRLTGSVIFSLECGSLRICVEAAVAAKTYLSGANQSGANMIVANKSFSYLSGA